MNRIALLVLFLATVGGCGACQTPKPPPPTPSPDCIQVCERWKQCAFTQPSPLGMQCPDICARNSPPARSGWNLACMLSADVNTCDLANVCTY